jgi:hypothetical protein
MMRFNGKPENPPVNEGCNGKFTETHIYIYIYINGSYWENHLSMVVVGQSPVNTAF